MSRVKAILRHWNGANKRKIETRPEWFSYEKCYRSVKNDNVDLHILLDGTRDGHHFEFDKEDNVVEFTGGTDHDSLRFALDYVKAQNFKQDDIVYFIEDDYLHRPGWSEVMIEAFDNINSDYLTLYDHLDKYHHPGYDKLQSKVLYTKSCHWRTTPSTCNTYAGKWSTFIKHWDDHHYHWCLPENTHDGYDHTKFVRLWQAGSNLISSIPAYSTHCEKQFLSPLINWSKI